MVSANATIVAISEIPKPSRWIPASLRNKMDISYSMTEPGYRAWLEDGNKGSFEDFLQDQVRMSNKEWLIEKILAELNRMNLEELKQLLEAIYDRNFIK